MIETSAEYKQAIKADIEETILDSRFGFITPGAVEGANVESSTEADASRLIQVKSTDYEMGEKWATLEHNRFLLDGSFILIDESDSTQKVGFMSHQLSDDKGNFVDDVYLDYVMDGEYDLIGIMLFFDSKVDEYATNITMEYYNGTDALIKTQTFVNTEVIRRIDMPQMGVKRIRTIFHSWNVANRMAKVASLIPGQIYYLGKTAFEFEYSENIAPFDSSITFPEFVIKFDNSNKEFNIVNPTGLADYLRQKMMIKSQIGVKTNGKYEYISAGDFYVFDWPDDTQEDQASFTCRPSMAFEEGYYVAPGTGTQTVSEAADIIFKNSLEAYTIETELQNIVVNQYIGDNVTMPSAMAQLAIACGGYWQIDRDGKYNLKKWIPTVCTNTVDYDNMYTKPAIRQGAKVTSVNVKYHVWNNTDQQIVSTDNIVSLSTNDGTLKQIDSCFIGSAERANAVAELALDYYSHRLTHSCNYRGDISIQAGDNVAIENDYGSSDVMILHHELSWSDKALSGTLKGVGI